MPRLYFGSVFVEGRLCLSVIFELCGEVLEVIEEVFVAEVAAVQVLEESGEAR